MSDNLTTKPTLETLLEMMRDLRDTVNRRFDAVDGRFDALDIRLDRMDSFAHKTYSEMAALRADFNESKVQLREHRPDPK
jgi:hypothetical protein